MGVHTVAFMPSRDRRQKLMWLSHTVVWIFVDEGSGRGIRDDVRHVGSTVLQILEYAVLFVRLVCSVTPSVEFGGVVDLSPTCSKDSLGVVSFTRLFYMSGLTSSDSHR